MASEVITGIENSGSVIFMKQASEKFKAEEYHANFTSRLVNLRQAKKLTDITLKCGDLTLTCHKVVLAAASAHFHHLFTEAEDDDIDIVYLKTFNSDILSTIVDFIYTDETTLTTDNVQMICSACDELGLKELKEGCDNFMSERVEPANCFGLFMQAKRYDLTLTHKACMDCMKKSLKDILRLALDQELKTLDEDGLKLIISRDDLEVEDEAMVFKLVERWVLVDCEKRMKCVDSLIEHVRLAFCSPSKLSDEIKQSPLMQSMKCALAVIDAFSHHATPKCVHTGIHKPRQCWQQLQMLLFDGHDKAGGKCWSLDTKKEQWNTLTNLPVSKLLYFKACESGGDIIVTGGNTGSSYSNAAWSFCLHTKEWRSLPAMIDARHIHAMVSIDREVYVMGGYNGSAIDKVEKLDAKRQGWTQLAPMKKALKYHVAVNIGNRIYVMGGGSSVMTQMYDVTTGQWQTKGNMPEECQYGSAVVLNGTVYVVGSGSRCCMRYEPAQDTWTTLTRPQYGRTDCAAAVWRGRIVLSGGSSRDDGEEYDPDKDQWTPWQATLPVGMSYHTMLTVPMSSYQQS